MIALFLWVVIGFIVGFIFPIVSKTQDTKAILGTIILGVIGSLFGGLVINILDANLLGVPSVISIFAAAVGSLVFIFVGRTVKI